MHSYLLGYNEQFCCHGFFIAKAEKRGQLCTLPVELKTSHCELSLKNVLFNLQIVIIY